MGRSGPGDKKTIGGASFQVGGDDRKETTCGYPLLSVDDVELEVQAQDVSLAAIALKAQHLVVLLPVGVPYTR
jgi:hypothetical protein